jgi:hypothetical protein
MANLTTAKLLINSTISTPGANFFVTDLANFYLITPMPNPEYMCLRLNIIPKKIIAHYNLYNIVTPDGWVYIEIQKGMYGLPQAGILTNQLLKNHLATKGYYQCQHTPGLWSHIWQNTMFCLVVNDFGIKVTNVHDMDHLINGLKEHYTVAIDTKGSLFCVIHLTWNYMLGHVNLPYTRVHQKSPCKVSTPQTSLSPTCSLQGGPDPVWCTGSEGGG